MISHVSDHVEISLHYPRPLRIHYVFKNSQRDVLSDDAFSPYMFIKPNDMPFGSSTEISIALPHDDVAIFDITVSISEDTSMASPPLLASLEEILATSDVAKTLTL